MRLKFRTKLTVFIGAILVAIQLVNTVSVYTSTRQNALEQGRHQLTFARNILNRQIDELTARLAEGARVVTLDFGFREAIAVGDEATKRSVILNMKDRVAADRVMLISLEDEILFDTGARSDKRSFPFIDMLETADVDGRAIAIASFGNTLYRLVVVPVLAPEPIAWIGIGLEINDALAHRLQSQAPIPMDITFSFRSGTTSSLSASTLAPKQRTALAKISARLATSDEPDLLDLADTAYIVLAAPVKMANENSSVTMVLQYSVQRAISGTYPVLISMIVLLVGGLGLALVGGFMLARGVSRPLNQLVNAAERVGKGEYAEAIDLKGNDEFGTLSSTFNDMMTGIRAREEKISHQARYDSLTGLLNRTEFVKALEELLTKRGDTCQLTIVVLGVARLPETNSTLGYETGDGLIKEISHRLTLSTGSNDLLARMGGDTFGLVFDETSVSDAEAVIARLKTQFERPIPIRDFVLAADLRFGLAFHEGAGGDAEQLIHQAEIAEFKTHGNGRDWHIFDPETDEVNPEQLLLITEMRHAIEEQQFELHYQPKINLKSEEIFAVEALIRWQHPERGMVSPGQFIPLAEQTGDVRQITQWALGQALKDATVLRDAGRNIQVAINLSALDLGNSELPDQVSHALAANNLSANALILEITESSLMSEPAVARNSLAILDDMGIALSVDDYGTGYSSLAYLKDLPVSELKIDQAFVRDMATNSEDELIVRSTVDLGHNLGLKVTAEGIEDAVSFAQLQRMGCDVGQGYFIAKPMNLENLIQFLSESKVTKEKDMPGLTRQRRG